MTGSMLGIRGWIMRLWHSRLRRNWRKLRAGTLRRLGLLPPASGPSPGQIASAPVGMTGTLRPESVSRTNLQTDAETAGVWHRVLVATREDLRSEPIFETSLRPDPETLSVWHDLLGGWPEDTSPLGDGATTESPMPGQAK